MSSLYFDNAATSYPKPQGVYKAVNSALKYCSGNPGRSGHGYSLTSSNMIYEARCKIAELFDVDDPTRIIFTLNGTAAINTAVLGLHSSCRKIMISDVEHNCVYRSVVERCRRNGGKFVLFKTFYDKNNTLREFENAIKDRVDAVVINAASNVDGRILPIEEIGARCRTLNIPYVIDASQLAGHFPISFKRTNCDFMCCTGHKALFGPMGCGFAILSDKGKEWLPLVFGGNGLNSKDAFVGADLPERYESGTLPVLSIAGLSAGVDHVLSIDFNEKQDRYRSLISTFINDISDNGNLKIYHAESGCPIISITHDRIDAENIAEYLWKNGIAVRAGLHCAPLAHQAIGTDDGGTVRFSMSEFNTVNDCKYVASLLSKLK